MTTEPAPDSSDIDGPAEQLDRIFIGGGEYVRADEAVKIVTALNKRIRELEAPAGEAGDLIERLKADAAEIAAHLGFSEGYRRAMSKRIIEAAARLAALQRERDELAGDARTLRGYIKEFGETPSMTASLIDTPVGRRRHDGDPFYAAVVASLRAALTPPEQGGGR